MTKTRRVDLACDTCGAAPGERCRSLRAAGVGGGEQYGAPETHGHIKTLHPWRGDKTADTDVAALGANGYVVVPRHLLDELLVAARQVIVGDSGRPPIVRLKDARAAVVEAVGPTREDQQ